MTYNEKSDYYAAATIRAIFASQGAKVSRNLNEFLLDFQKPAIVEPQDSRSVWLSALGIAKGTE